MLCLAVGKEGAAGLPAVPEKRRWETGSPVGPSGQNRPDVTAASVGPAHAKREGEERKNGAQVPLSKYEMFNHFPELTQGIFDLVFK